MSSGHTHYYELVDLIHLYDTTKIILPFCITNQVFSVHYTSIIHYLEANSPVLQILLFMLLSRSETFKNIQQTIPRSEIWPGTAAGQATRSHGRNQATRSRTAVVAGGHARAQQAAAGHARAATRGRRVQPAGAAGGHARCCRAAGGRGAPEEEKKNSPDFFGREECGAATRKKRAVQFAHFLGNKWFRIWEEYSLFGTIPFNLILSQTHEEWNGAARFHLTPEPNAT
ncbi:hypothetical protein GUJ93_ZPchr0003g16965 [Zizania palustris]|uniref:Uncharacterized protein n=1 Tax=Zizania palustris TaxID=103762 RepID=A0A8J5S6D3_ZIZPA|nr:hypothetical protein GUJ93_ZPchr0003g16965 [Zizania palustris]